MPDILTFDLRGKIPGGASIEFLRAEVPAIDDPPVALIRYSEGGKESETGLRLDLNKQAFLDHFEGSGQETVLPMKNRAVWGFAAVLAVAVLGGIGVLGVRLQPYWVAKYRGRAATLHGAVLILAPLAGDDLWGTNLHEAQLRGANLTGACLNYTDLRGADLSGANLVKAFLNNADLRGANLRRAVGPPASLFEADLRGADLTGVDLTRTYLRRAVIDETTRIDPKWRRLWELLRVGGRGHDLRGLNLRDVNPANLNLIGARYNAHTRWPAGFDPLKHGAILVK